VDEIRTIRLSNGSDDSSKESPNLGPPPVAHLDYGASTPILLTQSASSPDRKSSPMGSAALPDEDEAIIPSTLTINLETRRKRKDSAQSKLEVRRHSLLLPQSPTKEDAQAAVPTMLRTGAKRKLADRENDKPIKPPSKGDFSFSRKSTAVPEARGGVSANASTVSLEQTRETAVEFRKESPSSPKAVRKVLGEKSVNLSPRKVSARVGDPNKKAESLVDTASVAAARCGRERRTAVLAARNDSVTITFAESSDTISFRLLFSYALISISRET
jgi:hypothetical protein